jgi:hypothetical protein
MGHDTILLRHTEARHRGRRVTVLGVPSAGLLAVTGYGTAGVQVLGLITVVERAGRRAYRVFGHPEDLQDLDAAAAVLVDRRF